jgi:hypothetical protein
MANSLANKDETTNFVTNFLENLLMKNANFLGAF